MTDRNKLIELCKKLLPKFSQELKKCKDYKQNKHLEYMYILEYVKKIYDKDKTIKIEHISSTFDNNIQKLIKEYVSQKKYNNENIISAMYASLYHKLFVDPFEAIEHFVFNIKKTKINFLQLKNQFAYREAINNACEAYPPDNRPRGEKDISSIEYHRSLIREKKSISPIWIINKSNDNNSSINSIRSNDNSINDNDNDDNNNDDNDF